MQPSPDVLAEATRTWAGLTVGCAPRDAQVEPEGTLVVGRYALRGVLGQGGGGAVFRAWDRLDREEVALKLVPVGEPALERRARRELAALRWLRVPGVVSLRDDGHLGRHRFLVMGIVAGRPFPGEPSPPWPVLRERVADLLRTLAVVHRAGVLHRDLKPSNVLVTPEGRPVILDFGIARGGALGPSSPEREFTPGYAAPEQVRGQDGDARSDLYALGRMVESALGPDAPAEARDWASRLARPRARERPASAEEALALLPAAPGGRGEGARVRLPERVSGPADLEPLFAGPERFLHGPSDAAAALWTLAGPERGALEAELDAWTATDLARWEGARWAVDRVGLSRLLLLRAPEGAALLEPSGELARRLAERLLGEGRVHEAQAALERALSLARGEEDAAGELGALTLWARVALAAESAPALERAIYEVQRSTLPAEQAGPLERLLLAMRSARKGEGARALATLDEGPLPQDPDLVGWTWSCRVAAARALGLEAEEEALARAQGWAGQDPARRARADGWLGNLRYRQGRYAESAALHLGSIPGRELPTSRLGARVNGAMALLEVPALDRAEREALTSVEEARRLRSPSFEAIARWLARQAAHRRGDALTSDPEAVDGAAALGPYLEELHATTEAAVAWWSGELATCAALAARAERACGRTLDTDVQHCVAALRLAAEARLGLDVTGELPGATARALGIQRPFFAVQAAGLLWVAGCRDEGLRARARELAEQTPRPRWGERRDLISYADAQEMMGLR